MSSFDDDADRWGSSGQQGSETEIDRQLRRAFQQTFADTEQATEALDGLRPTIRRAHTVHRIRRAAVGAATAAILVVGIVGAGRLVPDDEIGLTVAGEVDGNAEGTRNSEDEQELAVNGTTTTAPGDGAAVGQSRQNVDDNDDHSDDGTDGGAPGDESEPGNTGADSTTDTISGQPAPTTTISTTRSSSSGTTGSTSAPTTDPDSSTSIQPDGSIAVISACGRIIVDAVGGRLTLIEMRPDTGFRTEVKESTPRRIEISLEGAGGHCEIKIRPEGNGLDVEVDNKVEHG